MSTGIDVHRAASLLLRQHEALMDEGIGPAKETSADKDLLTAAWELIGDEFGLHWGYEYEFVESGEHVRSCDCAAGKGYRGELSWCRGCQRHEPDPHQCRANYAVTWLTS